MASPLGSFRGKAEMRTRAAPCSRASREGEGAARGTGISERPSEAFLCGLGFQPTSFRTSPLSNSLLNAPATNPWTRLRSLSLGPGSLLRWCPFSPTSKNDGPRPVLLNSECFSEASCVRVRLIIKAGVKDHAYICVQTSPTLHFAHLRFRRSVGTCECLQPPPARRTLEQSIAELR